MVIYGQQTENNQPLLDSGSCFFSLFKAAIRALASWIKGSGCTTQKSWDAV